MPEDNTSNGQVVIDYAEDYAKCEEDWHSDLTPEEEAYIFDPVSSEAHGQS